jgi:hypothetical protein
MNPLQIGPDTKFSYAIFATAFSGIENKETIMSQSFQVRYTAYRGQGSEVLAEGTVVVSAGSRMQAEDTVKAQFGLENRVIIHSVFSA